jgi:phospholipase C
VGIEQIKHVVILMQENRSFDQYFGTLPGANGFSDPSFPSVPPLPYLPFRASTFTTNGEAYHGDDHGWQAMHADYTPGSGCLPVITDPGNIQSENICPGYGYSAANDIPYHWILANTFCVLDHWFASVLGPTAPNRLYLMSGCMRSVGGPDRAPETAFDPTDTHVPDPNQPAPPLCNNDIFNFNNNPLAWDSYPVMLKNAAAAWPGPGNFPITWNVYEETGDTSYYCDPGSPNFISPPNLCNGWGTLNVLNAFADPSASNWNGGTGKGFIADAQNGTLPTISWIIPPFGASEWHNFPSDGAQYIAQKLDAILTKQADGSSVWNSTVFIVIYDENDGAFDHVDPEPVTNPPTGTNAQGQAAPPIAGTVEDFVTVPGSPAWPIGPGYRSPAFIISPWTVSFGKQPGWNVSGAQPNVNSQPCDHTAVLQLLELVTAAIVPPEGVRCTNIGAWRRWRFNCGADFWNNIFQETPATVDEVRPLIPMATDVTQYQINTQARLRLYYGNNEYDPAPSSNPPWPPVQQQCYFQVLSQTSFGLDDVQAAIKAGTSFSYNVVLDSFDPNEIANLNMVTTPQSNPPPPRGLNPTLYVSLTTTDPNALEGMEVVIISPKPVSNTPGMPGPQRWTVSLDLVFNDPVKAFQSVNMSTSIPVTLTATFSSNLDWSTSFPIELVAGADPFMLTGPIQYLATDLRAYRVFDDGTANNPFNTKFNGSPTDYIIAILGDLNSNPGSPLAALFSQDPADSSDPDSAEALVSQVSHFPTDTDPNGGSKPVYNFALARVTLQGETQPANDVQVLFRLFPAPSSGTFFASFDAGSAYSSVQATEPNLRVPTVGVANGQILTIPFFASPRSTVTAASPDMPNVRSIQPAVGAGNQPTGEPVYAYFGCWLDLNQQNVSISYTDASGSQSSVLLSSVAASEHQCLVAEIQYAGLPIQSGAIPGMSTNQIAQRNLAVLGGTS